MTDVYCNRTHYGVTVRFDTFGSGYQVFTGSTRIITLSGTSRPYYTKYQGKDTPLGIYSMSGNLIAKVTNDNGSVVNYSFSARV